MKQSGSKVITAMSTRKDGNMSFLFGEQDEVENNRNKFLGQFGIKTNKTIFIKPEHGSNLKLVSRYVKPSKMHKEYAEILFAKNGQNSEIICDGIFTKDVNVPLALNPADCLAIFLWNEEYIGIVHAGRSGTTESIILKAITTLLSISDSFPLNISFSNCIGPCCYRFNFQYIYEKAYKLFPYLKFKIGNSFITIDLLDINTRQAFALNPNVFSESLKVHTTINNCECTCCTKTKSGEYKYFSHLRSTDKTRFPGHNQNGRNMTFIIRQ